jgi:hypothetical protein
VVVTALLSKMFRVCYRRRKKRNRLCPAADATVGGLVADGWEWSTTFGLCRVAIALAKENNGLDDGLYHLPLQGCGVPYLSNAETATASSPSRSQGGASGCSTLVHTSAVNSGEY